METKLIWGKLIFSEKLHFRGHFGDTDCYKIYIMFIEIGWAQCYEHPGIKFMSVSSILLIWC